MPSITESDVNVRNKYVDKKFLIAEHKRLTTKLENLLDESPVEPCPSLPNYSPFRLHKDYRVSIPDFIADPNVILMGKVFICRTIVSSIKMFSLLTVAEVPGLALKNKAVFLSLFNSQDSLIEKLKKSIPIFGVGTILAVWNPVFFQPYPNEIYAVKCDNPADISVLSQIDFERFFPGLTWPSGKLNNEELSFVTTSYTPKMNDWKSIGHYWLERKNFISAIQAFTAVLDHNNMDTEVLTLRCSLYLKLKLYQKSLQDSSEILSLNPSHKEGIIHRANSLIGLKQYSAATKFLKYHTKKSTTSADSVQKDKLMELLLKAKTFSNQEKYGDYDVAKMFSCKMGYYHHCADYMGPIVEQYVLGKGRGMIATKNIKCGELIVATKAFEMSYSDKNEEIRSWHVETENWVNQPRARVNLIVSIANRLIRDPESGKIFYKLYAGNQESSGVNYDEPDDKYVNMKRITSICHYNSFSHCSEFDADAESVVGIWPSASLFNHGGFDSNSIWRICGNVFFLRASRDIIKGEEITLLYVSCTTQYPDRVTALSEYNFTCNCSLCSLDSQEPTSIHDRRKQILQEIIRIDSATTPRSTEMQNLIDELKKQRLFDPELNVYVLYPIIRLAAAYYMEGKHSMAAEILLSGYEYSGETILSDISIRYCLDGIICSLNCKNLEYAKRFAEALKISLIQAYGVCTEELLRVVAADVAEAMTSFGIVF